MRPTGLIVPTAFDASPTATILVRGPSDLSRSPRSRLQSSRIPTQRIVTPRSSWSASHGATLASWSSRVTTISSPAFSVRPIARLTAKVRVVMFWPKATSSGPPALRKSAAPACASASLASLSSLVANAPS
jgi:hypothetical protein